MTKHRQNVWTKTGGADAPLVLYIHIPFCQKKCDYCDFLSFAGAKHEEMARYMDALCHEIHLCYFARPITSIFIGGGTPSYLSLNDLEKLLKTIQQDVPLAEKMEYTIEMNPGTITREKLQCMKKYGVNRLSFGVQAFQDELLQTIGRIHKAQEAKESIQLAREMGFENINIDLMIGLPKQTKEMIDASLQCAMEYGATHISVYTLILEEGTPLNHDVENGTIQIMEEDDVADRLDDVEEQLMLAGYHQYEISNYAKDGYECIHNCSYWRMTDYIGLGLGSSGAYFDGQILYRTKNTENILDYTQTLLQENKLPAREIEKITPKEQVFERIMLGLRMNEGVQWNEFVERFGCDVKKQYREIIEKYSKDGYITDNEDRFALTREGRRMQNLILLDFMEKMEKEEEEK